MREGKLDEKKERMKEKGELRKGQGMSVSFTRLSAPYLRTQKFGLVERNSKTS